MSSSEHIPQVMTEIGPMLGLMSVRKLHDRARWILELDEDLAVVADYLAEDDRLFLTAEAGPPAAAARARCHELLLIFNGKWAETGGLRMALDDETGTVLQICDVPGQAVTAENFEALLENFVRALAEWMEILAAEPTEAPPAPLGGDAIRV